MGIIYRFLKYHFINSKGLTIAGPGGNLLKFIELPINKIAREHHCLRAIPLHFFSNFLFPEGFKNQLELMLGWHHPVLVQN
jgi:hypothetical protein